MRVDWQGRLDARGYHVTPVDRPDAGARWVGETTTADDGWTEGDAIVIFDSSVRGTAKPQELTVQVGDHVYMTSVEGEVAEIVQVVDFFAEPESGAFWFGVRHASGSRRAPLPTGRRHCTSRAGPVYVSMLHFASCYFGDPVH